MTRTISLVGAPSSAGAYAPGQEKAPAAFRRHGLVRALEEAGCDVRDHGDVDGFRWRPDPARPKAMNLQVVQSTAAAVADKVFNAISAGDTVFVLGGDCTVELGTVVGALRHSRSVGLVYIDLDADLNPPDASDGALDWTGVAHLLDIPGAASELSGLAPRRPILAPDAVALFATDVITPSEAQTIGRLGLEQIRLAEVKADPTAAAKRAVAWASRFDLLLVHLDVDVLAFTEFPIAENVDRRGGLSLHELGAALSLLVAAPNWRALTLTEVNPDHAPDEEETFGRLIGMLRNAFQ